MKTNRRLAIAMAVLLLVVFALDCWLMPKVFHTHGASHGGIIALTFLPFMVFAILAAETIDAADAWATFGLGMMIYLFVYGCMVLPIVGSEMNHHSHYDYTPLLVASWLAGPVGYLIALMTGYIFAPGQTQNPVQLSALRQVS